MSLDTLFQQILLTEQQLAEQTQKIKDVKIAIIRCNERIKSVTEQYGKSKEELDEKAQQLSAMRLQYDLAKKYENQMLKQIEELLCQKSHLREHLSKIKRAAKEEEENFLQEISKFNSDFSLKANRETVFKSQTHTVLLDLEKEVESIYKDLDRQLSEAEAMTESLRSESQFVSQKPLSDSACLRLRKEMEMHREGQLEHLREELSSEIQFLQSKLESSQGAEQC
ncbi:coiled-coil domain-containing protein 172 isoform X2 [Oreochromis aureus]|uniref:Coiled-coil domain-containing protein 172 n=1 Tax=Oreochromis aureus TaxID=47969 RepID=A0AAZ1XVC8_OREAU|nr:coiled-coil domain-containing protein 172 isoform X2 [Oreochromis aureus]